MDLVSKGAASVYLCLSGNAPCLIGRNGTIELQVLHGGAADLSLRKQLELHAGVFPSTEESVGAWIRAYKAALNVIDTEPIVAGWYPPLKAAEESLLKQNCFSESFRTSWQIPTLGSASKAEPRRSLQSCSSNH